MDQTGAFLFIGGQGLQLFPENLTAFTEVLLGTTKCRLVSLGANCRLDQGIGLGEFLLKLGKLLVCLSQGQDFLIHLRDLLLEIENRGNVQVGACERGNIREAAVRA